LNIVDFHELLRNTVPTGKFVLNPKVIIDNAAWGSPQKIIFRVEVIGSLEIASTTLCTHAN
jgi:hypothetical protein